MSLKNLLLDKSKHYIYIKTYRNPLKDKILLFSKTIFFMQVRSYVKNFSIELGLVVFYEEQARFIKDKLFQAEY